MKTILYATDYSENSVSALHFAHALSKALNTKLVALHVFDVPVSIASPTSITYSRKEVKAFVRDKEKLVTFCTKHLGNDPDKLNITIKIDEDGSIWDGILEKADSVKADLIVVGTKGTSPIREFLFGSTTTSLIEKANCPVLAIPPSTPFKGIKTVIYATDFEGADIFTIKKLTELTEPFDAKIHLVHVATQETAAGKEQMDWFKDILRHKVRYQNIVFETLFGKDVFLT